MRARTQGADTRTDKARTNADGYVRIYERGRTDRPAHPSATPQGQTRTETPADRQADGHTNGRQRPQVHGRTEGRTYPRTETNGHGRTAGRTRTPANASARPRRVFSCPAVLGAFLGLSRTCAQEGKKKNAPQGVPTVALGLLDQSALVHPLGRLARQMGVTDGLFECAVFGIPAVEKEHGNAVCKGNICLHSLRVTCSRP